MREPFTYRLDEYGVMMMRTYVQTNIGLGRTVNQDAYYVPAENENFCVLADGMGGHQAGEVASAMAVKRFVETLRAAPSPSEDILREAVKEANACVYEAALQEPEKYHRMGTTLTALWFDGDHVFLSHVGDSRAYLLRNRALMQLSRDHSLVGELLEMGEITPQEAKTHPQRNLITRAVGTGKHVKPDVIRLDLQSSDVWMLCSDGLSNYVTSPEAAEILLRTAEWDEKIDALIQLALSRGGSDNITVLIAMWEEAGK